MWPRLGLFVPGSPCVKDEPLAGFPYKSSRLRKATRLSRLYSSPSGHRQRVTANFPAGKSCFSQLQTQGLASPTACSRSSAFQNMIPREAQAPPLQARTRLLGGSMAKISSAAAGRNFRACKNDAENSASPRNLHTSHKITEKNWINRMFISTAVSSRGRFIFVKC